MLPTDFPTRDRISLCMIVRNEEQKLARALTSARPWVGEIVVVDTGSTDRTVAIAESFGARVLHFTWVDDFSAARNFSLEAASRPWALVLDADEELVVVDPDEFGRAVNQDVLAGFNFRYHNRLDNGETAIENVFRLFHRALPGMRYRGRLHEQIAAVSDRQVHTAALGCCYIKHDGHTSAAMAEGKIARNVELSRRQVADRPDDPFAWYCLGLALSLVNAHEMVQAFEKALALLEAASQGTPDPAYGLKLCLNLAQGYRHLGQPAKAKALLDRAIAWYDGSPDLHYMRGTQRLEEGDAAGAVADLQRCQGEQAASFFSVCDPAVVGYKGQAALGEALLMAGRPEEGEALLSCALAAAPPGFAAPGRRMGSVLLQRGEWESALPYLQSAVTADPGDSATRFNLGWCLYKLERYEEAEAALQPLDERPDVQHLMGKICLEAGQGERALAYLEACPLPAAGLARGWARYVAGKPQAAADCWQEWLRAGAADWGTKDTLAMFLFLLQGGRRPSGQPERPAEPLRDMDHWFRILLRYQRFEDVEAVIRRGPQLGDRLWRPLRKKWAATLVKEDFVDVGTQLLLDAQKEEPGDPEVYYWLGVSALRQRHVDDARVLWQTCLRYAPDHRLATQGLSLLH